MTYGVDISNWQGVVNFDQLKSAVSFVIMKASEGLSYVDPQLARNQSEARRVDIARGYYHYADGNDPVAEANHFANTVGQLQQGEIVALDFEIKINNPVQYCKAFLDQCAKNFGVNPVIYINLSTEQSLDWSSVIAANDGLWIANWSADSGSYPSTEWPFVAFRQFTDAARVAGVAGNVDEDTFNGTIAQFKAYGKGGTPSNAPVPPVQPVVTPVAPAQNQTTVQGGDTLSGIAARNGMSLQELEALNPQIKNPNLIYPGEVVYLASHATPNVGGQTYVVKNGDTMSGIAVKFGQSLQSLEQKNPQVTNPNLIFAGQTLNV